MLAEIIAIMAPVLITTGIGFGWGRLERPFNSEFVTAIVTNVGAPCLVLSTFAKLQVSPAAVGDMALATLLAMICFALIGAIVLGIAGLSIRTFLPPMIFPNNGNIGLPLSFFAFGREGLGLAIVFFAMTNATNFTVGQYIAAGRGNGALLFRSPMIYALLAGLMASYFGLTAPRWLQNTVDLIGGVTIPLMLLALGVSIGKLKVGKLCQSLGLSVLRLGMGFLVALFLAHWLELNEVSRGVLLLQSAAPCAVFNYLFALRYDRSPEDVAGVVVASTLLSFALLPLLLLVALPNSN